MLLQLSFLFVDIVALYKSHVNCSLHDEMSEKNVGLNIPFYTCIVTSSYRRITGREEVLMEDGAVLFHVYVWSWEIVSDVITSLSPVPSYRLLSTIRVFDNERECLLECCYLPIKLHTRSSTSLPRTLPPLSVFPFFLHFVLCPNFHLLLSVNISLSLNRMPTSPAKKVEIYNINYFRSQTSYLSQLCTFTLKSRQAICV